MTIKEQVQSYREELLERLGKLVAINSARAESTSDAPFGEGPKAALKAALQMLDEDGFRTVNLDNYAGYAEIGSGEQLIGIIGHLDIVPAAKEDGWDTDPFEMVRKGDTLYGRGVSDDKGAVVATMIALKVLRDLNVPLTKRVRLIMGTNEESGSRCLKYYVEKEGHVDYGFTPDGNFPGVYGEKGMISARYFSKETRILDIQGGTAGNIVCGKCTAVIPGKCYSSKKLADFFNNNNIEYNIEQGEETVTITVFGKAAHASTPELGVNAISYLLVGLREAGFQDPFVEFYCSHIGLNTNGDGLGCKLSDSYGELTLNCGIIRMQDGVIEGTIDIRFPVTMTSKQVMRAMQERLDDEGGYVEIRGGGEPLFFSPDSPLVTSLLDAYRIVTGDTETMPMTIGGGTYAKGIHNTIAFGCAFPNRDYRIHNTNEFVDIDELLMQAEIYVHAILNLMRI
ncbi:MAG: Sapep family Mn(2+)-dependent dipeptidase [Solobacterium sp.]|nr:Sapep family Mn(2+)-dependent dipeptidase [Solobacterium sp.]